MISCTIVIATHKSSFNYLEELLFSLNGLSWPIIIVVNGGADDDYLELIRSRSNAKILINDTNGFEVGALRMAYEQTDYQEFMLMQDTTVIKDRKLFDLVFADRRSYKLNEHFQMYLGKFRREPLTKIYPFPNVRSKRQSVYYESVFCLQYEEVETNGCYLIGESLGKPFSESDIEIKYGKRRLRLENEFIIKWKGVWHESQIPYDWPADEKALF